MPVPALTALRAELAEEHAALDAIVAPLPAAAWRTPTPATGWDVRDTIGHLCFFDETAALALTDPVAFEASRPAMAQAGDADRPDVAMARGAEPAELLARWRTSRAALLAAVDQAKPGIRVPWYGPPMSVASFVTARLMETWAHGQDVVDAAGAAPVVSARLRHVCHIGIAARPYAFAVHGLEDPGVPIRVEVASPDGVGTWTWGPEDAADRVTGDALDLALVVTQRRHRDDTALVVEGPAAKRWIAIAQAYAGPAGEGRRPGLGQVRPV
jgi:uncharacterized protein (TIGR03084 family)